MTRLEYLVKYTGKFIEQMDSENSCYLVSALFLLGVGGACFTGTAYATIATLGDDAIATDWIDSGCDKKHFKYIADCYDPDERDLNDDLHSWTCAEYNQSTSFAPENCDEKCLQYCGALDLWGLNTAGMMLSMMCGIASAAFAGILIDKFHLKVIEAMRNEDIESRPFLPINMDQEDSIRQPSYLENAWETVSTFFSDSDHSNENEPSTISKLCASVTAFLSSTPRSSDGYEYEAVSMNGDNPTEWQSTQFTESAIL
ncbi:MAG: hypothetical protein ACE365_04505 [Gammaproteobacteria bacterium]